MLRAEAGATLGRRRHTWSAKDAMLNLLFRRLTAEPARGAGLFAAVTAEARRPGWYVDGQVADSLDGRFAVLATICALVLVRLEREGIEGDTASVALTERFIEVMESEHRELGIGDPGLGKQVRKLVGALSVRTDKWREAVAGSRDWNEVTRESIYRGAGSDEAVAYSAAALRDWADRLDKRGLEAIRNGQIG